MNPFVSVTLRGGRGSFPSLGIYLLEGQPIGKEQGRGELEVGTGCIPDSISKSLERSEENALQQMNTPQVLVEEKNPFRPTLVHSSNGQVITGVFPLIFLNSDLILDHFAVEYWGLSSSFT